MPLQPGDRVGAYEILSTLGAGGMGVVYRARDARLGRDVAIKTLPEDVAADPERLARFEREARALAALNHPNVATIYGFEQSDALHFLTMEVVEGATLADRIERGPMPLEQALPLFIQIAEGLEAAHAKGIVHRDLKPANIKIAAGGGSGARSGAVKILDFGLAKALAPSEGAVLAAGASHSPTLTIQATMRGELLGTAAYMSPEQAEGEPADERADIWAFGVCLLEALTGRRVFSGANASRVLASVLKDEPDFGALPPSTPPVVRRLLRRCLEKNRERRLRDIGDVRLELEEVLATPAAPAASTAQPEPVAATPRRASRLSMAITAGAALAVVTGTLLVAEWLRAAPEPPPLVRSVLEVPAKEAGGALLPRNIAIARDASVVLYDTGALSATTIRARRLDQLDGAALRGVAPGALGPFLSPDDRWVGYFDSASGTLRKISILGGPSVTLFEIDQFRMGSNQIPFGVSWGADDTVVFGQYSGPLQRVPAAGGAPQDLTQLAEGEASHRFPEFLPGGDAVLFAVFESNDPKTSAIHVLSLPTGQRKLVVRGATQPRYASSGHLIYAVGTTLYAAAFDARALEVIGDAVPVVEGVNVSSIGSSHYAVSASGALVYVVGGAGQAQQHALVWVDREGHEEPIGLPPGSYLYPRLSPDGSRIAVDVRDQDEDIWIWDLERETWRRLTFSPRQDLGLVWSPDGQTVFFASQQEGDRWDLVGRLADGSGEPVRLSGEGSGFYLPASVTPDGSGLIASKSPDRSLFAKEIVWVDTAGKAQPRTLLDADFRFLNPQLSPDGRWLAYESIESGGSEIVVRPFPALDSGLWQVSTGGGTRPLWSRDGEEIFYLDASNFLTAVGVEPREDALSIGRPEVVIGKAYVTSPAARTYDVSPDGRRFLMIKAVTPDHDDADGRIVLVQNWFDELRRLAPPRSDTHPDR